MIKDDDFTLIGHTHSHISGPYWPQLLLRDIDRVLPVIYAMAGKDNGIELSIVENPIVNVNESEKVWPKELVLEISCNSEDFDVELFYDSCERLNLSSIVDHWMITKCFEIIKSDSTDSKFFVPVSLQSLSSLHLWNHLHMLCEVEENITIKIIPLLKLRRYQYNAECIDPWFYKIRKWGFNVALDCENIIDYNLIKIAKNCPEYMIFSIYNLIKNRIEFDINEEKNYHILKNVAKYSNSILIAGGIDNIDLCLSAIKLGYNIQQGKYWNFNNKVKFINKSANNEIHNGNNLSFFHKKILTSVSFLLVSFLFVIFTF